MSGMREATATEMTKVAGGTMGWDDILLLMILGGFGIYGIGSWLTSQGSGQAQQNTLNGLWGDAGLNPTPTPSPGHIGFDDSRPKKRSGGRRFWRR